MKALRAVSRLFKSNAPLVHTVRLRGVIGDGPRNLSLRNLEAGLDKAFDKDNNPNLKAVAVIINSPGGSPTQSSLIAARIRLLSKEAKIPVYTFSEDVAASGGYWLLCAGDHVYADPTSIIGSIGVVTGGFGFSSFIEKWGIERRLLTAGENKARNDPFRPVDPSDVEKTKKILSDMHSLFKAHVIESRGARLKGDLASIFSGDAWLGGEARDLGLVDGLGDPRAVLRRDFGDEAIPVEITAVDVSKVPWLISPLLSMRAACNGAFPVGSQSRGPTDNPIFSGVAIGETVEAAINAAETRAAWQPYRTW